MQLGVRRDLGEDLEKVAVIIIVDQDAELLDL